jgi:FAD synthase
MIDENKLIPCNGVYSVLVTNEKLKINQQGGMMNIGYRPTVEGNTRTIEVNLFDFDQSLYDETLTITLKKYLRSEVKFSGLDELKKQLEKDKQAALDSLKGKEG